MKQWYIGCSGFSYKHWKSRFYPEGLSAKKWLEYYCEHFNTVELNVTFYRLPKVEVFRSWFDRSPDEFKFTVKVPRLITHYKRFKNITTEISDFYRLVSKGLGKKLGSILFQLHPKFEYTPEHLSLLLKHLDPAFTNVIEFRHPSWWQKSVYSALKKANITFCSISYPNLPTEVVKTSTVIYYRFHGVPQLYLSSYNEQELQEIADHINSLRGVHEVYAYFNNDIDVHAISNGKSLQQITKSRLQRSKPIEPALSVRKPFRSKRRKPVGVKRRAS
jgi:uncharacterized protein YecE (DUF72 family)